MKTWDTEFQLQRVNGELITSILKKKKKKKHKKKLEKGKTRLFLNPVEDRCCLSEIWRKSDLERELDSLQNLLGPYTVRTL